MTAPIQPQPSGPSLEGVLAQKANDAIQKGADPRAVTDRLGLMVQHLRDNPDVAQFGESALSKGADPTAVAGRVWSLASQAQQAKQARTMSDGSEATAGVVPSALDAATFGLSRKITAALPVMQAVGGQMLRHPFTDFSGTADPLYRKNLAAQDAATAQYHAQHPVLDTTASLAGGVGGVALTGGLGAVGDATAQVPRLARWGKLAVTGAGYGAANAAGHSPALDDGRGASGLASDVGAGALAGTAGAALSIPVMGAGGWVLARTPLPRLASRAVGSLSAMLPGAAGDAAATTADAINPQMGRAQQVIGQRAAMDAALPAPALHPSLPPMALNTAGPNVEALAEGIANKPGPGRATIVNAVTQRQAAMRPAITAELERTSETPAGVGLGPLQGALDRRAAEAKVNYDAAREATKGQAVSSPTFEQIKQTPAGKAALQYAMGRQGNMFRELPTQVEAPDGFSPEQWQQALTHMKERGILPPAQDGAEAMPDPETLHIMGQRLSKMAKVGDPSNPLSSEAASLIPLIQKVKGELPDVWQEADKAYADHSRLISMMDRGRNIFRTPANPAATGKAAVMRSLDGVDQAMSDASGMEQAALQRGAGIAAHAKLADASNSMKSPGRIFGTSDTAKRQLAYAMKSPEAADDFQQAIAAWDKAQQQTERIAGNSRTALRQGEAGSGDLIHPGSLLGQPRRFLRGVINKLDSEYQAGAQQQVDAEIAKILTSPDMQAIPNAAKAGVLRARLIQSLQRGAGGSAALQASR